VPEGPPIFYQTDRANGPPALIQDQPRGLFTDFLIIKISTKITACQRKKKKEKKKKKRELLRKKTLPPPPNPPAQGDANPRPVF